MGRANIFNQFARIAEPPFHSRKGGLALRRIAPERQNVRHPRFHQPVQDGADFLAGGPYAGKVGHSLNARLALDS
jgi:hypothetical protein